MLDSIGECVLWHGGGGPEMQPSVEAGHRNSGHSQIILYLVCSTHRCDTVITDAGTSVIDCSSACVAAYVPACGHVRCDLHLLY